MSTCSINVGNLRLLIYFNYLEATMHQLAHNKYRINKYETISVRKIVQWMNLCQRYKVEDKKVLEPFNFYIHPINGTLLNLCN